MVVVICQRKATVDAWADRETVPFPVFADDDRAVAKRWGVWVRLNLESFDIARPASFVVGPDGRIRFAHVGRHQLDRGDLDGILDAVKG